MRLRCGLWFVRIWIATGSKKRCERGKCDGHAWKLHFITGNQPTGARMSICLSFSNALRGFWSFIWVHAICSSFTHHLFTSRKRRFSLFFSWFSLSPSLIHAAVCDVNIYHRSFRTSQLVILSHVIQIIRLSFIHTNCAADMCGCW